MQAEQRARVARVAIEIVAEHALGLRGVPLVEQRRAERFADRIEPDRAARRTATRSAAATAFAPELDRLGHARRAPRRCARRARSCASARIVLALSRPVPPKSADSGTVDRASWRGPSRSAAASSILPVARERHAAREVPPRRHDRTIGRRLRQLQHLGVLAEAEQHRHRRDGHRLDHRHHRRRAASSRSASSAAAFRASARRPCIMCESARKCRLCE